MFEIIFIILLILYAFVEFLLNKKAFKEFSFTKINNVKKVTVIVAARNEEKNILRCLNSLDRLIYPEDKIEIIIVDDNSEDNTNLIVSNFIDGKNKFKLIKTHDKISNLIGKTNALANALKIASGDIIFTTDADCVVNPNWVKKTVSYFQDDVVAVFGYTYIEGGKSFYDMLISSGNFLYNHSSHRQSYKMDRINI